MVDIAKSDVGLKAGWLKGMNFYILQWVWNFHGY